ncbi:hypothetical protein DUT91_14610 [Phyllobacterium salinisoli]|uniref:Uncharacterized protein n=1 Tax=Phyllobacterium salinisoli TaxID=1899321 RepID=A0A368K4C7_9HYPH|nr:hypothetical protein [Phyllobacterium salinisoli]RCS23495.1 hypothetical protein DUT91_14610 [Phyllobacterium salinisoli]
MSKRAATILSGIAIIGSWQPAVAAPLDRFAGSYRASGTVVEGPKATKHRVGCNFTVRQPSRNRIALQGTCRAYLVVSRSISADLALGNRSGRVTGTYTGSRVGPARLVGQLRGGTLEMTVNWPRPLYGDTTARMRIVSLTPDRLKIVVTDRIGAGGPTRATTDLTLVRR